MARWKSPGRVFLLRDEGEPIQTARTLPLRNEKDLVTIGDFAVHDSSWQRPMPTIVACWRWRAGRSRGTRRNHSARSGEMVAQMRILPDGRVLTLNGGRELKEFKSPRRAC